jgi:hypothetical protein
MNISQSEKLHADMADLHECEISFLAAIASFA